MRVWRRAPSLPDNEGRQEPVAGDPRRARREAATYRVMTYTDAPRAGRAVAAVSRRLPPSCNNPRGGDCEPQTTVELGPSAQRLIISMNRTTRSAWQAGMTAACAIVLTVLAALVAVGCGSAVGGGGGAPGRRRRRLPTRPQSRLPTRPWRRPLSPLLAFPTSTTKALRRATPCRSRCPQRPEEQAGTNTGC